MKKITLIILSGMLVYAASAQTKIDRSKPPKAGPAPVITIGDPVTYRLANGITVLVVENHKLPKVAATYSIDAGPIKEGSKAGVISLMGEMLNEGTRQHAKADFDEQVDRIGADVNLGASGGSVSALTRYFDKAFMLMAEAIKEPAFTQESFDKLKSQTITGLKSNERNVKAIAARVTNALVYGTDHPNGEFETEQTINALTLNDVKSAYQQYVTPSRGYLTFVGDITPAQAKLLAEKAFAGWKGASLSLPQLTAVNNPSKTEIDLIDVPNAVQTEIRVVNLVQLPMSSPDYFPVLLANQILGGGSESRLFMNLREKHGFTYGSYSEIGTGRFQNAFTASAAVRNEKVDSAVSEILNEINRIRTSPISDDELRSAKALYNGSFALGMENPARIANFASNILINDLPKDFYRTYLQRINAVTKEDIQRVANKYFNYNNTRIIAVGKGSQISPGLQNLGYTLKAYDKYAQPATTTTSTTSTAAPAANISSATVINDYLNAIGGVAELSKVNSVVAKMEMELQGMKLSIEQKAMLPDMEVVSIAMNGNVVNKTVFNGTTGYAMQMGNKTDMPAEEINSKKNINPMFTQLSYTGAGFKTELKGTEKINNADAYKVIVTTPAGKTSTEYYDIKSKLLIRSESAELQNGLSVNKTADYSDYRRVDKVMIPFKQTVTVEAGGQSQTLEMKVIEVKLNTGVTSADFK
ncbi:MAG: insulinase-like:Peptidase C-terminal precursor [Chitinophagaceae bacterium]|nr:insulinase-like:Peptidase C-terminal precursor [Chitinophagaceae bacterium]